ncbi:hypothetical protein ACFL2T_02695, partial [Elusimicrobiota bacterium]
RFIGSMLKEHSAWIWTPHEAKTLLGKIWNLLVDFVGMFHRRYRAKRFLTYLAQAPEALAYVDPLDKEWLLRLDGNSPWGNRALRHQVLGKARLSFIAGTGYGYSKTDTAIAVARELIWNHADKLGSLKELVEAAGNAQRRKSDNDRARFIAGVLSGYAASVRGLPDAKSYLEFLVASLVAQRNIHPLDQAWLTRLGEGSLWGNAELRIEALRLIRLAFLSKISYGYTQTDDAIRTALALIDAHEDKLGTLHEVVYQATLLQNRKNDGDRARFLAATLTGFAGTIGNFKDARAFMRYLKATPMARKNIYPLNKAWLKWLGKKRSSWRNKPLRAEVLRLVRLSYLEKVGYGYAQTNDAILVARALIEASDDRQAALTEILDEAEKKQRGRRDGDRARFIETLRDGYASSGPGA